MAANNYKIGDRVIIVSEWKKPHSDRFSCWKGRVVTIDSICRCVLNRSEERFYQFAELASEGHIWDDCDIVSLAPMLPRKRFAIWEGMDVIILAHDGAIEFTAPGTVIRVDPTNFVVRNNWNQKEVTFRIRDFLCDDPCECCRQVVYATEADLVQDQNLVSLQRWIQDMFWKFTKTVPSVDKLISFAKQMGLYEDDAESETFCETESERTIFNSPENQEGIMKIQYRHRTFYFADGYFALATGEGNPCDYGCGVALRCEKPGGKWGWSTKDIIHICTFNNSYCAKDLAKALNDAKKQGIAMFDVDAWIQEKIDSDAKPGVLTALHRQNAAKPNLCPHNE